jgi:hypothetical protein
MRFNCGKNVFFFKSISVERIKFDNLRPEKSFEKENFRKARENEAEIIVSDHVRSSFVSIDAFFFETQKFQCARFGAV